MQLKENFTDTCKYLVSDVVFDFEKKCTYAFFIVAYITFGISSSFQRMWFLTAETIVTNSIKSDNLHNTRLTADSMTM